MLRSDDSRAWWMLGRRSSLGIGGICARSSEVVMEFAMERVVERAVERVLKESGGGLTTFFHGGS